MRTTALTVTCVTAMTFPAFVAMGQKPGGNSTIETATESFSLAHTTRRLDRAPHRDLRRNGSKRHRHLAATRAGGNARRSLHGAPRPRCARLRERRVRRVSERCDDRFVRQVFLPRQRRNDHRHHCRRTYRDVASRHAEPWKRMYVGHSDSTRTYGRRHWVRRWLSCDWTTSPGSYSVRGTRRRPVYRVRRLARAGTVPVTIALVRTRSSASERGLLRP